jgi:hypothetical protein
VCHVPRVNRPLIALVLVAPAVLTFACGGSNSPSSGFTAPGADDAGTAPVVDASTDSPSIVPSDASFGADIGPSNRPSEVYGNSPDTLYKLDPDTKAVEVVGTFDGCSQIIDIALDKDSRLFGTTSTTLVSIDRKTAKCSEIARGSYPNSLSFVPAGTLDPSVEALVGYEGDSYVRIDPLTGAKTTVGSIGGGLASSGDIVSVKGGGTYLTVTGVNCKDCLIEVNPATGALVKNWGSVQHAQVFGLAFWAGKVYGFDNAGELFEVTFNGAAIATSAIAIPSKPTDLVFWGAGSTTSAPITPN